MWKTEYSEAILRPHHSYVWNIVHNYILKGTNITKGIEIIFAHSCWPIHAISNCHKSGKCLFGKWIMSMGWCLVNASIISPSLYLVSIMLLNRLWKALIRQLHSNFRTTVNAKTKLLDSIGWAGLNAPFFLCYSSEPMGSRWLNHC